MRLRYLLFTLLIAFAMMTGDWLASPHAWWVFDIPADGNVRSKAAVPSGNAEVPLTVGLPSSPIDVKQEREAKSGSVARLVAPQTQTSAATVSRQSEGKGNPLERLGDGPIAVVHSRRMVLFNGGKPMPGELERLRAAMIAVSERWDHPILIFDADGATLNTLPAVLYADEKHDVTSIVLREMKRDVAVTR